MSIPFVFRSFGGPDDVGCRAAPVAVRNVRGAGARRYIFLFDVITKKSQLYENKVLSDGMIAIA